MRFLSPFKKDEAGSQTIEFGLVLLPLMAFVFLIMDIAWVCFAQSSLQHAVQTGVRAAVSGYVPTGTAHQDIYLKTIVQSNAMGFLAGTTGWNAININYYSPSNLSQPLTGTGSNAGGNVVEISVSNVTVSSLGPILRETMPTLHLQARSSDVMEGSPDSPAPTR